MAWRVGVDIGGTFTDVAVLDEATGHTGIAKVSTTPHDFGVGVVAGLQQAITEQGVVPAEVSFVSHATTVVTNALLEAKGARVALVCTQGFRDLLELRRSARADLYDLNQDAPAVLVPRHCRLEVNERIDAQGRVVTPLQESDLDNVIASIRRLDVEAVAVCLLFSFVNNLHEAEIGARLRAAFPDTPVFLSSEVLPEIREFERLSTTAVCAYVGPILESYLRRLEGAISELGFPGLYVMGSSGGVFNVDEGLKMPAMAVESGPAAGVIAAAHLGRQIGNGNLISFDMGGTTAKASLIENGVVETTSEYEVGGHGNVSRWLHGTGHPIRVPVVDLAEVSAGGGSIAWIDPGGALRVGPESAGAAPGPVCYGRGGTRPTVTDADVILGYLNPAYLLGGRLSINRAAAVAAVKRHIADPLTMSVQEAAAGIVGVVNHSMAEALRIVSVARGYDAREFSLVAFGGAGPVHAAALAEELDIREVIIPPIPGGFSALGLVTTDLRRDYSRTYYATIAAADAAVMRRLFGEMEEAGRAMLAASGIPAAQCELTRSVDCRYVKQAYELNVTFDHGPITAAALERLAATFHARHRQVYGHDNPDEAVQIVNVRLTATGHLPTTPFAADATDAGAALPERQVWFPRGGMLPCPVHTRADVRREGEATGPLIIEEVDTTVVVPPDWSAAVDARGFIRLTRVGIQLPSAWQDDAPGHL
jgi:N-methylhydantoinase A